MICVKFIDGSEIHVESDWETLNNILSDSNDTNRSRPYQTIRIGSKSPVRICLQNVLWIKEIK